MKIVKPECETSDMNTDLSREQPSTNHMFECQLHPLSSFENLNSFRKSDSLCDITIKVESHLFRAHKVVLSSASPYFHAMFTSDLREKSAELVELYDVDPDSVSKLIDFIYTSKIQIVERNVQHLLPASNLLQLTTVRDACCNFLKEQLDPSNALGILLFGDTHGCKDLVETTETYVLNNFASVSATDEFLSLNFEKMKQLLSSDFLMTNEESQVYSALINWIKHDVSIRKEYIGQLLALIRVPLMPRDFLMLTVEPEDLVKSNTHCKDILIEAMKYHLMPEMRRYLQTNRTQPRTFGKTVPVLFVIGGQSLFAIHCECEMYNTTKDTWETILQMSTKRARVGVGVIYDKVYAVGGFDGSADLSTMEVLHTKTQVWSSSLPMGTARSCLGVAVLHNLLYAIGGYDGSSCLNSVERYDPLSNQWVSVAKMNARRRYVSVGVINEHIVAAGGYDGSYHLDSCELYDPVSNIWTQKASMKTQRSSAGGCVLNGFFYVSGGTDGSIIVISVERYDITTDQWTQIRPMSNVRMTHSMVVFNNKLVVIGGNDGTTSLNSIELYNEEEDSWTYSTPMNTRRSHVATATMIYL